MALGAVAQTGRPGAAGAADLVISGPVGMVLAEPTRFQDTSGSSYPLEIVGRTQRRGLIFVAQLLFREKPKVFVAVLGFTSLLPKIVGTGPDIFFVGLHSFHFQFMRKIQDAFGRGRVADRACVSAVLLCFNEQVRSLIHETALPPYKATKGTKFSLSPTDRLEEKRVDPAPNVAGTPRAHRRPKPSHSKNASAPGLFQSLERALPEQAFRGDVAVFDFGDKRGFNPGRLGLADWFCQFRLGTDDRVELLPDFA
jgi:hypothetical protein